MPLRDTEDLPTTINFVVNFGLDAIRYVTAHYLPGFETHNAKWYIAEIRPLWQEFSPIVPFEIVDSTHD